MAPYDAERAKHFDALMAGIADLLDAAESGKGNTLSTVPDREMAEMAFGNPAFMMRPAYDDPPFPFGVHGPFGPPGWGRPEGPFAQRRQAVTHPFVIPSSDAPATVAAAAAATAAAATGETHAQEEGPRLIIHESPVVKVTKVEDPDEPHPGTTLESLFLGVPTSAGQRRTTFDGESMDAVDHESIHSGDVGINYGDEEEEQGEEPEGDDKIPFQHQGKTYFRGLATQRVFEAKEDGTPGGLAGLWMSDTFIPLSETVRTHVFPTP